MHWIGVSQHILTGAAPGGYKVGALALLSCQDLLTAPFLTATFLNDQPR